MVGLLETDQCGKDLEESDRGLIAVLSQHFPEKKRGEAIHVTGLGGP
jgi:hypothetical protein